MKISICIPVYNVQDFLVECLESVVLSIRQCARDSQYELIMVDDASTDGSFSICQMYAEKIPQVILHRHEYNKGLAEARNTLLSLASGDYIAWVDSDDTVSPDWLPTILRNIDISHPDVFAFELTEFGINAPKKASRFGVNSFRLKPEEEKDIESLDYALKVLQGLTILDYSCTRVVKRALHEGLTYRAPRRIFEDTVFAFDFLERVRSVRYCARSLYNYRQRQASIMHCRNIDDYIKEIDYLLKMTADMRLPYKNAAYVHIMSDMRRVIVAAGKNPNNKDYQAAAVQYQRFFRQHLSISWLDSRIPLKRKLADMLTSLPFSKNLLALKKT